VGENESFTCDVRVLCATHRKLDEMVAGGEFREDLWFRINTFEIRLPPLRDRIEDIPTLARHLAQRFSPSIRPEDEVFTPEALAVLAEHSWPGNVRELANCGEHAMILCDRLPIGPEDLPMRFTSRRLRSGAGGSGAIGSGATGRLSAGVERGLTSSPGHPARCVAPFPTAGHTLRDLEMRAIYEALDRSGGNKSKAAEELGISLKTLYNKLSQASAMQKSA
jgi:two-component system NtrC family response regulator